MPALINRQPNGTIEISFTLPWSEIQKSYEKEVIKAVENTEIPGFRKGKAPRDIVEPKLDQDHLYSDALESLLPATYAGIVKEHNLKPILYPKIKITKAEKNSDWEFTALTCESPVVEETDYQSLVKKVVKEPKDTLLGRIIDTLHQSVKVTIPDLLVEEEANHRLASLAENLTKLGLTTESYLQAKKNTLENLRSQTAAQSRGDLETEFILEHIRKHQNLPDRAKTLDFLISLV